MSTVFKVDTSQIAGAAGEIMRISNDIESGVRQMMTRLTSLQESWQGSAASGFQGVVTDWERVQAQVRDSLDTIRQALERAGQQYSEVEQANTSMFRV